MFWKNRGFTAPGPTPPGERARVFPSPAAEPAYDFTVKVRYRRAMAVNRGSSWWLDERELERTREIVRETARHVSRNCSIFHPGEAERLINGELDRRLADGQGRDRVPWAASVEVAVPDEVREMMRKEIRERYLIESHARADEVRLNTTEQLRRRWAELLANAAREPLAPHAFELAENPEGIAKVLRDVLEGRQADVDKWLGLVSKIVEAHKSAGVLELVVESDTVLRKTMEMMGIELPPLDPDAPFVPTQAER